MITGLLSTIIGIVIVAVIVLIILIVLLRSFRVARPDEALIITGRSSGKPARVAIGTRALVLPIRERAYTLSLASRSVKVKVEGISRNGIKLFLEGVAQVKVGGDEENVRLASQRFLEQQDQIEAYTQDILAGSLRAVVGTLSVEQIIHERAALAHSVQEVALDSLNNQGLIIDTLQISSVEDDTGYLKNLGRPESAQVEKAAAIAEASARQEAAEKQAVADEGVAVAEQRLAIRRAEIKEQTDARQAAADAAGPLAQAQQRELIIQREEQVAVRQAELTEKQLDTQVRRPADAAKYKAEQEAAAELARRRAEAEARKADGLAEAESIGAAGRAEAEAIEAKAEAYSRFNQAAIIDRLADVLPKVAHELSEPYANIDDLTVISTDGASKLSQNIAGNFNDTVTLVERMTGVDLRKLIGEVAETSNTDPKNSQRSDRSQHPDSEPSTGATIVPSTAEPGPAGTASRESASDTDPVPSPRDAARQATDEAAAEAEAVQARLAEQIEQQVNRQAPPDQR
jgi:flotillin